MTVIMRVHHLNTMTNRKFTTNIRSFLILKSKQIITLEKLGTQNAEIIRSTKLTYLINVNFSVLGVMCAHTFTHDSDLYIMLSQQYLLGFKGAKNIETCGLAEGGANKEIHF